MDSLEMLLAKTLMRVSAGEELGDIKRRWRRGQMAICHCPCKPVGRSPREVLRGGKLAVLADGRGGEHVCPTAALTTRP